MNRYSYDIETVTVDDEAELLRVMNNMGKCGHHIFKVDLVEKHDRSFALGGGDRDPAVYEYTYKIWSATKEKS